MTATTTASCPSTRARPPPSDGPPPRHRPARARTVDPSDGHEHDRRRRRGRRQHHDHRQAGSASTTTTLAVVGQHHRAGYRQEARRACGTRAGTATCSPATGSTARPPAGTAVLGVRRHLRQPSGAGGGYCLKKADRPMKYGDDRRARRALRPVQTGDFAACDQLYLDSYSGSRVRAATRQTCGGPQRTHRFVRTAAAPHGPRTPSARLSSRRAPSGGPWSSRWRTCGRRRRGTGPPRSR